MKFLYEYRTSDNVIRRGEIVAPNRDEAYVRLKSQGIRPSRVVEAAGIANMIFGKGKRWIVIGILFASTLALAFFAMRNYRRAEDLGRFQTDMTRRQIVGDSAIIEKGLRTAWADVFPEDGERFLAGFAVPGRSPAVRQIAEDTLAASLARRIVAEDTDSMEVRQVKSMVEGVKEEMRSFLAAGGSVRQFATLLVERQEAEIGYYERAKNEIETMAKGNASDEELEQLWEKRNGELRKMGVRLIPMPERAENGDFGVQKSF